MQGDRALWCYSVQRSYASEREASIGHGCVPALICFSSNLHVTGFSSWGITTMIHSYLVCVCFSVQPLPAAHGGTLRFCLLGASHACVGGRPPNQATVLVGTTRSTYRPWSWWLGTESNHHLPNAVTIIWISISWQLSVYIHSPIYLRLYLHTYLSIHLSIYLTIYLTVLRSIH